MTDPADFLVVIRIIQVIMTGPIGRATILSWCDCFRVFPYYFLSWKVRLIPRDRLHPDNPHWPKLNISQIGFNAYVVCWAENRVHWDAVVCAFTILHAGDWRGLRPYHKSPLCWRKGSLETFMANGLSAHRDLLKVRGFEDVVTCLRTKDERHLKKFAFVSFFFFLLPPLLPPNRLLPTRLGI